MRSDFASRCLADVATQAVAGAAGKEPIRTRIEKLLASASVLLFMKGSSDEPKCGFSRRVADAIRETGEESRR